MDKKVAVIAGLGVVLAGAYLLLKKPPELPPSGGGAYGPSGGFEGGGEGLLGGLLLGGDVINFPAPEDGSGVIQKLLQPPPIPETGDSGTKKETSVLRPGEYEITPSGRVKSLATGQEYTPLFESGSQATTKKETTSGGFDILGALLGGVGLFASATPIAAAGRVSTAIAGAARSGISSGDRTTASGISAKKPYVSAASPSGTTSYQTGGSSKVKTYVQSTYGSQSNLVLRGYSRTGVPLYRPK